MHRKHPTLPTKLNLSFKKMALKIAVMTTLSAPNGVTKIASTKA